MKTQISKQSNFEHRMNLILQVPYSILDQTGLLRRKTSKEFIFSKSSINRQVISCKSSPNSNIVKRLNLKFSKYFKKTLQIFLPTKFLK